MNNTTTQRALTAEDKARIIEEALATLRAADAIDERVTLTPGEWVAWCDAVLPDLRNIELLAGAMRIKFSIERGKKHIAERERRGGDQKSTIKVSPGETLITDAVRTRRWRDRRLATHEEAVNTYIRSEAAAGRMPTEKGALHIADSSRAVTPRPPATFRDQAGQERTTQWARKILVAVDVLADGTERSSEQIRRILTHHETQRLEEFLRTVYFLPWLAVSRTGDCYRFTIDARLRAICDGLAPRPELPNDQSIAAFFTAIGEESDRRRKENECEYRRRRWNPDATVKKDLIKLLDYFHEAVTMIRSLLA